MIETALKCEKLLREKGKTVATAESCTGGLISSAFVSIPGCSDWFKEGCVTYSAEAKIKRLGVKQETVNEYTVVSPQVALEMACGVRAFMDADIGLATTGYAGPGGGDDTNPVGTVYVGCVSACGKTAVRLSLDGDRNEIRQAAVCAALELLYEELLKI